MIRSLFSKITRRLRVYKALRNASKDSFQRIRKLPSSRILVLCYGNIYRSPFVAKVLVDKLQGNYTIKSSGFHPASNRKSPPDHVKMATEYGVDLSIHTSTEINKELVKWADIIILMDRHNWDRLQSYGSIAEKRVIWLGAFSDIKSVEIEDPYGKSEIVQREILDQLFQSSNKIINILEP